MVESKQCLLKYGLPYDDKETTVNESTKFENKWMTLWDVPSDINTAIPVIPNKIYCNKDLVTPLEKAFRNIIYRNLTKEIKTWDGCFNIRLKRGLNSLSLHSWAIAIDINAAWNGLGKIPTMSKELVQCFVDAGFEWGGNWTRLDGMHFQLKTING
jgi:hypothetical protein